MIEGTRPRPSAGNRASNALVVGPQLRDGIPAGIPMGHDLPAKGMLRRAAWMARTLDRREGLGVDPGGLDALARAITVVRLDAGTRVLSEGQHADEVAMVERGEIELYQGFGARRIVVQILRSGDVVGDVSHFCQRQSDFSARALTDVTMLRISGESLARLLRTDTTLCHLFLFSLAGRLGRMQHRVLELARGDLRNRIAALLVGETGGVSGVIRLPQATLAHLLGASRSSVNRILKEFETQGLLRVEYRRVEVLDVERLREAAL
jgi:CRP-like cAMP-binding protein